MSDSSESSLSLLTSRQLEALRGIHRGLAVKEIASEMQLSVRGVEHHLRDARRTLGANSSRAAARAVFGDYGFSTEAQPQFPAASKLGQSEGSPGEANRFSDRLLRAFTEGKTINDLTAYQRLSRIGWLAIAFLMAAGLFMGGVGLLNGIIERFPH